MQPANADRNVPDRNAGKPARFCSRPLGEDTQTFDAEPRRRQTVDPLHIGATQTMLDILKQYPVGNAPPDRIGWRTELFLLLFNAPVKLDYRTYVASSTGWWIPRQALCVVPRHVVEQTARPKQRLSFQVGGRFSSFLR